VSDGWAVALALSTAAGALLARSPLLGLSAGAVLVVVALGLRRPLVLCLGAALLSSGLAARSWDGLDPPPSARAVTAERVTLVTDPAPMGSAVRTEARLRGKRLEVLARGQAAVRLRPRLAGERVEVSGRLQPVADARRAHLASRHIVAQVTVQQVGAHDSGSPPARLANRIRRVLVRGTGSLSDQDRALFTGLVLGDDREQDPGTVDDFRGAGLTHLLAVSGQNVAFVIMLASPVLRRLGLRGRFAATMVVLLGFGVLTRWEPSVMRAAAMAAITVLAVTLGRPVSTMRVLALAVTGLLLLDPLLVRSVGFQLSSGACAGIALLAGPLSGRGVPKPLAVTLAAQVGVAPVLVPLLGGMPVASLAANLLAVPAAGPVMAWGLVAGPLAGAAAGLGAEPVATALHLPTRMLVGWVAEVAEWAASLPLGQARAPHALAIASLVGLALCWPRIRPPALVAAAMALIAASVWPPPPTHEGGVIARGARLWRTSGATVLVVDGSRPLPLLTALREARVRGLDVVALRTATPSGAAGMEPVLRRHPARLVLTPTTARPGSHITVGGLRVEVLRAVPKLDVRVRRR
jgi:competence protein ComEC